MKKWDMRQMKDGNSELRYLALTLECVTLKFLCSHFLLTHRTTVVAVSHCDHQKQGWGRCTQLTGQGSGRGPGVGWVTISLDSASSCIQNI